MAKSASVPLSQRARTAALVWAALAMAALLVVGSAVYPGPQRADAVAADAVTTDGVNFGDCSFRTGSGVAEVWANQVCWLDMSGLPTQNGKSMSVKKKVGGYTLTFDAVLNSKGTSVLAPQATSPWGKAVFGQSGTAFFERQAAAKANDVVPIRGGGFARFTFSNIKVTDAAGNPVSNYRFALADAESTGADASPGEILDVANTSPVSKGVTSPTRLTPAGYKDACSAKQTGKATYGPGVEPKADLWGTDGTLQRDFVCWDNESSTYNRGPEAYGGFVVGVNSPTSMEIGIGTVGGSGSQAFALGVGLSRIEFPDKANQAKVENAPEGSFLQQNAATAADYSAFSRNNTSGTEAPIAVANGGLTTLMRSLSSSGTPEDMIGFRSQLTQLANPADGLKRYDPVWKCTLGSQNVTVKTIREGSVPDGFSLSNDAARATSTLLVADPENAKLSCSVNWESRFKPATLNLLKTVDGNAANFTDLALNAYTLHYACTAPLGFVDAYPNVKLEDDVVVENGKSARVRNLPQGANCTVTEKNVPAVAGIDHTLSWDGTVGPNKQISLTPDPAAATAVANVNATNNYSYQTGTLEFSKQIVGEPVTDGKIGGTYRFSLTCEGTNAPRDFTLDLTQAQPSNSISLKDIPAERDCSLTPLTDLTKEQRQTMKFVGRDATLGGAPIAPDASNAYHFTLHKGQTQTLHFTTSYAYLTFPLTIRKEINGLAAGNADLASLNYTVHYSCMVEGRRAKEGTATLDGGGDEVTIDDVPAGASCTVWEDTPGDTANTRFAGATVKSSSAADNVTTLTNDEAKTTPVTTIRVVSGTDRNLVTVTNTFDPKLGTVTLTKRVNSTVTGTLPDTYAFTFRCGTRNVGTGVAGQSRAVELTGQARVAKDGSVTLTADDAAANDQNGAMGVPYGNTCTFTEETPNVAGGILFGTDVQGVRATIDQPTNQATVTNSFSPAGNGLTVSLRAGGRSTLAPASLSYELSCDNGFNEQFDLAPGGSTSFTAGQVPQGTTCTLTESGNEATRTTKDGRAYPISTTSEYLYAADTDGGTDTGNGGSFTIGMQSTMDVHHDYDFVQAPVSGTKEVRFNDPNHLISDPRRDIKNHRIFPVTLVCTNPDGTDGVRLSTTVQQGQAPGGTKAAVGSSCTVAEGETTTAVGITLDKSIDVNGTLVGAGSADFNVEQNGTTLKFINTYTRRTTSISLEKKAILPTDSIRNQYANAGKSLQDALYNHTFTLVCRDPETGDTAVLQEQTSAIKGEGSTAFNGVPVGADCQLTGDNFGSLALAMNDGTDDLKAFLRPAYVDWVVDREGGNAYPDQELKNDTTTSPAFLTVDDAAQNSVRLDNHYEYETSTVQLSKALDGLAGNIGEIPDDYAFNFALQCKAIGYQTSNPGEASFIPEKLRPADSYVIPASLKKRDFTGGTFTSGAATVPAGSLCTFQEQDATNTPAALTITPEQKIVRGYAPNPGASDPTDLHFVNKVERRTTPVRLAVYNSGYLAGADHAGYTAQLRCDDPSATTLTRAFPLASLSGTEMPRTEQAPEVGATVQLPVGANCTLDLAGSPALTARGQLEATAGERTPLTQYAQWGEQTDVPAGSLADIPEGDVTEANKAREYKFTTAATLPSDEPALTVAADIYHPRASYDVAFTKTSAGPSSGTFTFQQSCGDGPAEFQLDAGKTHTISGVPVDSECSVHELDDGNADAASVFELANTGELLTPQAGSDSVVAFTVQPVSDPTDLARSGDRWAVTAKNTFPGLAVEKSIEGTPLGQLTGDAFGTTLLRHDATSMRMTYTVTNTGEFPLTDFAVTDPSLAGYEVSRGGAAATVGDSGAIPASICPTRELAKGEQFACTFDVAIPAKAEETWRYPADGKNAAVTVTARAIAGGASQTLTASDSRGALKPSASISMLLPESGQQTLVLFLLLGLVIFGWGAWRVSRRDNEPAEGGELVDL